MTALCEVRREDPGALATLSLGVERALGRLGAPGRGVVFACIGTDRSTGDALDTAAVESNGTRRADG